jgi:hypothetical protein
MKKSNILAGLVASAALLISASANASIVVTEGGAAAGSAGETSSFATSPGAVTYNFNGGSGPITGGSPLFTSGSGPGYAAPYNDTTGFVSVGTTVDPATSTFTLPAGTFNYLGLYWGSIDGYNSINITDAGGFTTTIDAATYSILNPANGDQGLGGSAYVNIFDSYAITSVTFTSAQQAFEFDNLTVAAVPEASTWAMMVLGFLGLGFLGYRRSSNTSFRVA